MSLDIKPHQPSLTPTTLIDEVMSVLSRGEGALFAELAHATWSPQATLAGLTGTLGRDPQSSDARDAA